MAMAVLAVSLVWSAANTPAAQAQDSRERNRSRVRVESGPYGVFSFSDNRGRIGVIVDTRANTAGDKVGARIEAITPGGPAEKAGLKAGDVITRFNGTALGGVAAEDDEDSGPGMKLIELARALDPGDTVQVDYRRGTENKKVTLVAEDLSGDLVFPRGRMELIRPRMPFGPGGDFEFTFDRNWAGIELVKLNPDLGDYFGAREGVLVVNAPADSTLKLKGGDVITAIGGRKPTSPMQAMRILRSYDTGETVSIEVLRKRQKVTVSYQVPEHDGYYYKTPGPPEEPSFYRVRPKVRAPVWRAIRASMRTI
jgi:PDZ domain-containing secreted protein